MIVIVVLVAFLTGFFGLSALADSRFYVDNAGRYLGGYDGAQPPVGAIEVPKAPESAADTWDGSKWLKGKRAPNLSFFRLAVCEDDTISDAAAWSAFRISYIKDEAKRKSEWAKASALMVVGDDKVKIEAHAAAYDVTIK